MENIPAHYILVPVAVGQGIDYIALTDTINEKLDGNAKAILVPGMQGSALTVTANSIPPAPLETRTTSTNRRNTKKAGS